MDPAEGEELSPLARIEELAEAAGTVPSGDGETEAGFWATIGPDFGGPILASSLAPSRECPAFGYFCASNVSLSLAQSSAPIS